MDLTLRESMARRLHRRSIVASTITLPAVPAMIDEYVQMCDSIFTAVGRKFSAEQLDNCRQVIAGQLAIAYERSPRSNIVISIEAPIGTVLNYHVKAEWYTVEGAYANWLSTREPPLFGTEPDARIWALAGEAATPAECPVLDIGAGTGRNALALARRGHPVDAVEMTADFADVIRADAQREHLDLRVLTRDIFTTADDLRADYQLILLSEVVSDFRSTAQLRALFELAAAQLAPGGRLVFNTFLARDGYEPDDAARELGQQVYTSIFTRDEMTAALGGLPLDLIADDSVFDYERANLPAGAWPPTSWYADWVSGRDLFDLAPEQSPVEMRWLVYGHRTG
ncbi:Methyltransferase domain-containing protein [Mycolicibacterium rutilum]|uniref:Methyltransferase domain-containing protein n=1 Tax=Mycolicibacterium rutilum TaxID=370526 RepID=A0A1H6IDQ4_MYCRU|nr:class I SAM-dependent methyltransferase [Mycolicibacterium rutilum]SEH45989.1 Methyltransferase domain-containing protein [Mycolicibacterium rutilum]